MHRIGSAKGGPIFTTVGFGNGDNLLKKKFSGVKGFTPGQGWMRPSDGERDTETAKTSTRSPNDRRTTTGANPHKTGQPYWNPQSTN